MENQEYVDADETLTLKCPEGHVFHTTFNKFKNGERCPICEFLKKNPGYKVLDTHTEK